MNIPGQGLLAGLLKFGGKAGGVALAAGGADVVLNGGKNVQGVVGTIFGNLGKGQAEGGVETFFYKIGKFLAELGEMMAKTMGSNGLTEGMQNFGHKLMGTERDNDSTLPITDAARSAQREYEAGAPGEKNARFTLDGPNGSPASVELSDEKANALNTVSLGAKGVKDGLGVAVGSVFGAVAGAADLLQLDTFIPIGKDANGQTNWGRDAYHGVATAINETTDAIVYDAIMKPVGFIPSAIGGLLNGEGLSEAFSSAWDKDYEPTVRSETDLNIYRGTSIVTGGALTIAATGGAAAAFGIGGASLSTAGGLSGAFGSVTSGLAGIGRTGLAVSSKMPKWGKAAALNASGPQPGAQ